MKALVVGHGVMGKHHARTLRRLGVEVATVDEAGNADYLSLDEAPPADIACIATPPVSLAAEAAEAMMRGMDVMVEKPMACDRVAAQLLLQAELANGRRLCVGYTERWNPAVHLLRESLPLIGEVRHVTAKRLGLRPRCPRTGPALDLLTHDLDVLRFLNLWPKLEGATATECSITASFALVTGTATLIASHCHEDKQRSLTVVGTEGMLDLDYQRQSLVLTTGSGCQEIEVLRQEPLLLQWQAFLQGEGVNTGEASVVLDLALRAQEAAELQRGGSITQGRPHCTAQ
jgi:predicted dehydrogenase